MFFSVERDAERERRNEETRRREEEDLRNRLRLKRGECLQLFGKRFYRHSCEDRKFSLFTMHVAEKIVYRGGFFEGFCSTHILRTVDII